MRLHSSLFGGPYQEWESGLVAALESFTRPDWHREALCRDSLRDGASDWFAHSKDVGVDPNVRIARAVATCARCPVREQCKQAGQHEPFGIWGGVERDATRRRNAARASRRRSVQSESGEVRGSVVPRSVADLFDRHSQR